MPSDILSGYTPPSNIQPPTTKAQRVTARANQIRAIFKRILDSCIADRERAVKLFWDAAGDVTPQDMAAEFGTSAASLFSRDWAFYQFLLAQVPGTPLSTVPAGWTVVSNADGSVTLTPPPKS